MKQVNKHHDKLVTSRRIYDDHKSGKALDETPAETLTMMKKSFISIVVNLFSIISVTVLAACFFIYFQFSNGTDSSAGTYGGLSV